MTRAGKCHHVKAHIINFTDGWGIQEMKNERENMKNERENIA